MRLLAVPNTHIEKRLNVPMLKALTLPVLVDGEHGYALYVTYNSFAKVQPTDASVIAVAQAVATAINRGPVA